MSWKASIAAIQAESRQDAVYNSTTSRVDDVDVGRNKKINDRNNIRYEAKEASFDQMQEEQDQSLVKPPSRRKKAAIIPAYGPDEVDNVRTEGAEGIGELNDHQGRATHALTYSSVLDSSLGG